MADTSDTPTTLPAEKPPARERLRSFWRSRWMDAIALLLALVAGFAGFSAAARSSLDVGPTRFRVSAAFGFPGRTIIRVPPFGTVEARTHRGPARLVLSLDQIDIAGVQGLLETRDVESATRPRGLVWALGVLALTGALGAVLAALVVTLLVRRRRGIVLWAVGLALALPLLSAGVAYATFDRAALDEPRLTGALSYVPNLADTFSTRVADIQKLRAQASKVARDLSAYYADGRNLVSGGSLAGTYRVLHVSDLHLDPVGAQLEQRLVRSYDASLVIDTGDLPILGVQAEVPAYRSLVPTGVTHVYVPGNHDSAVSLDAIAAIPGVTILENRIAEFGGLRVFGVPDPISRTFGNEPDKTLLTSQGARAYRTMYAAIRSGEPTPDIVAVHNPAMEEPFIGIVPVVLSGHTHSARLYVTRGTVRLNSGTIGGTPYAPGTGRRTVPYTASVLYYTSSLPRKLIAIDRISVSTSGQTSVTRDVIDPTLLP